MTQDDKNFLNLAGEFLVAGELSRRQIPCSVTYGYSKKADVLALNDETGRVLRIEVKTTPRQEFIVGAKALDESYCSASRFWILVHLPENDTLAPRYFILSSHELNKKAVAHFDKYKAGFRSKNNREFTGAGVHKLAIEEVLGCEGNWDKISQALRA